MCALLVDKLFGCFGANAKWGEGPEKSLKFIFIMDIWVYLLVQSIFLVYSLVVALHNDNVFGVAVLVSAQRCIKCLNFDEFYAACSQTFAGILSSPINRMRKTTITTTTARQKRSDKRKQQN